MTQPIYHLALRDVHAEAGATFAVRHGWSLPTTYGDTEAEYRSLREAAVLCDRSHHSRFVVAGTDAGDVLATAFAGHPEELEEGRAMRTVALAGGLIDDVVIIARTGAISYVVIGEPSRREVTLGRLRAGKRDDYEVQIEDRTDSTCLLSLVGPAAARLVAEQVEESLASRVRMMQLSAFEFHGFRALGIRTSDTGEDGFLFMLAPAVAQHLIETLAVEAPLAGDDAHEIARVEACIPAFEPDLAVGVSPAEADLEALLDLPGGSRRAVLSAVVIDGEEPAMVGTELLAGADPAGQLRSCVYSPGLRATIGLALVNPSSATPGTELSMPGRRVTVAAKPLLRKRATQS